MFKPDDKVRIRATHVHCVRGYQIKALAYKRLVGTVIRVLPDSSCVVDFTQHDMPLLTSGRRPGELVNFNKGSKWRRPGGTFPIKMLEHAAS